MSTLHDLVKFGGGPGQVDKEVKKYFYSDEKLMKERSSLLGFSEGKNVIMFSQSSLL
jgi:hypothetical protein